MDVKPHSFAVERQSLSSTLDKHYGNCKSDQSFQYHMTQNTRSFFAPELHIPNGTTNVDFYLDFGAKEHFCFRNNDGSIHVVELEIDGAIFHLHETMRDALEPASAKGVTSVVGLFVEDVQEVFNRAISAGATVVNPVTDHDYGYRQGMFRDPFGHLWQIQARICKLPSF